MYGGQNEEKLKTMQLIFKKISCRERLIFFQNKIKVFSKISENSIWKIMTWNIMGYQCVMNNY